MPKAAEANQNPYIQTIESNGGHLYDITADVSNGELREHDMLELAGRVLTTEFDRHYLLARCYT